MLHKKAHHNAHIEKLYEHCAQNRCVHSKLIANLSGTLKNERYKLDGKWNQYFKPNSICVDLLLLII